MNNNNGEMVVDLLRNMSDSLKRSIEGVEAELSQRYRDEDYKPTYISTLIELNAKIQQIELQLRKELSYMS